MFGLLKKHSFAIGADIGQNSLKLAQLAANGNGLKLTAGSSQDRPNDIKPNSSDWQKWTIETVHLLTSYGGFHSKQVIASMPADDVFIDHFKMPKADNGKLEDAIFSKIKQKLPFEPLKKNTIIKHILTEQDNVMVIATDRKIIDRHLAIYEKAGLAIKSICVWPIALANSYAQFFGRRKSDLEAVVMLSCIEQNHSNVLICRHKNPLFAHSVSIGAVQLNDEKVISRFALELNTCKRQFNMLYRNINIERLIFMISRSVDREVCASIAKQMEMPAQVGDCLAAVQVPDACNLKIDSGIAEKDQRDPLDRRESRINWSIAFGLSLS
jgi:Tfp pilus assembly PilM family ATPase